jgi:hypothetical protein
MLQDLLRERAVHPLFEWFVMPTARTTTMPSLPDLFTD